MITHPPYWYQKTFIPRSYPGNIIIPQPDPFLPASPTSSTTTATTTTFSSFSSLHPTPLAAREHITPCLHSFDSYPGVALAMRRAWPH